MAKHISIVEVINSSSGYLTRGNNVIQKLSKEDISKCDENDKIFIDVDEDENSNLDQVVKEVFDKITKNGFSDDEFSVIFSGKLQNSSRCVMEKWLIKAIFYSTNNKSRLLINDKLKHVNNIISTFLTVFNESQKESVRCTLKYTLVMDVDKSLTNLFITPEWYDVSLSHEGYGAFTAYKIFYILAALSEKAIDQTSRVVEHRFLSALSTEYYSSQERKIINSLKEIQFSQIELDELFDSLHAILELSQYYCKGAKMSIEFLGINHLKMATKRLKVKDEQLFDFLVQEYTWKGNKQRLNSPENINRGIDSFICKLYEVIITTIFDKVNSFHQSTIQNSNKIKVNFYHSPSLPHFDDKRLFMYGDFLQYSMCSNFHLALSKIIVEKERAFRNHSNKASSNLTDSGKYPSLTTVVSELVNKFKGEENKFEYLKKAEKSYVNQIRFSKETNICAHIFIPEVKTFVKFDWTSFIDNSESYENKKMKTFFKISSNSIFRNYNSEGSIIFLAESEKIYRDFILNIPMAVNTFSVYSLIDDDLQTGIKYSLNDQIKDGWLEYLSIIELSSLSIRLDIFVSKYRSLFLNYNDSSKTFLEASKHAIKLLRLDQTWCCEHYIHISQRHIDKLENLRFNFIKNVLIVQNFLRQTVAKIKLRKLRILAQVYQETYDKLLTEIENHSTGFEKEYLAICRIDFESNDFNLLRNITPTVNDVEEIKTEPFQWLSVVVMSGSTVVAKKCFSNSKLCISSSNKETRNSSDSFDLQNILPPTIDSSKFTNRFIIKISHIESGDVILELKSTKELYAWNFETKINKTIYSNLSLSSGNLFSNREYRLFSMNYIWRKIAYCLMNRVPYSFNHIIRECSFAIILERDPLHDKSLSKAPLWLYFTNFYPIVNLSSHYFFNKVDQEIRKIDKNECLKFVKGPSIRPKDDWLTENVYTQLMLISLEKEKSNNEYNTSYLMMDSRVSNPRPSISSTIDKPWSKINYKLRKYMVKDHKIAKVHAESLI